MRVVVEQGVGRPLGAAVRQLGQRRPRRRSTLINWPIASQRHFLVGRFPAFMDDAAFHVIATGFTGLSPIVLVNFSSKTW